MATAANTFIISAATALNGRGVVMLGARGQRIMITHGWFVSCTKTISIASPDGQGGLLRLVLVKYSTPTEPPTQSGIFRPIALAYPLRNSLRCTALGRP